MVEVGKGKGRGGGWGRKGGKRLKRRRMKERRVEPKDNIKVGDEHNGAAAGKVNIGPRSPDTVERKKELKDDIRT